MSSTFDELINAIKSQDIKKTEEIYENSDKRIIQIEAKVAFGLTLEVPQFSGAKILTEAESTLKESTSLDDEIAIPRSDIAGEFCRFMSKNCSNSDRLLLSHSAALLFGPGGLVSVDYFVEEWNINKNGKHTTVKRCVRVTLDLPNDKIDENQKYDKIALTEDFLNQM